jgi:integrase
LHRTNGSKLDADLLTTAEIEELMRECSRRAPTGVRNRALVALLWRCGLRIGEALALAVKDFDPDSGTLVVQRGKGGKRRVVGVDSGTAALVSRWLEVRRKRRIPDGGPSFARFGGSRSTSRTSATCSRGSRAKRASRDACTRTGCVTRLRSTWFDPGRRST